MWSPPDRGHSFTLEWQNTDDSETADRWRAELSAGSLPASVEDVP